MSAVGLTLGYILNLTFGVAEILNSTTDSLSFGVSVFYPIIDGILLIPSMIIFWSLRKGDSSHMHWFLMSASFVMVTIGDIGFGYSFALSPEVAGEYRVDIGQSSLIPAMCVSLLVVFGFIWLHEEIIFRIV